MDGYEGAELSMTIVKRLEKFLHLHQMHILMVSYSSPDVCILLYAPLSPLLTTLP